MNEINLINRATNDPVFASLAMAFVQAHDGDPACQRITEKATEMLRQQPIFEFRGSELRITSLTDGTQYTTDGEVCSCPGRRHSWCKHRIAYRLMASYATLVNPAMLRAAIIGDAQPEPHDIYSQEELERKVRAILPPLDSPAPASWEAISLDECRNCGARLWDTELPVGLCQDCQPTLPPAAVALEVPRFTPRRSVAVGVPNAQVQAEADALLAA